MVCAVVFQRQGRLYYADPGSLTPNVGDEVLYPTDDGPEVAEVMWAPQYVSDDIGGLPVLVGMAGPDDREHSGGKHRDRPANERFRQHFQRFQYDSPGHAQRGHDFSIFHEVV